MQERTKKRSRKEWWENERKKRARKEGREWKERARTEGMKREDNPGWKIVREKKGKGKGVRDERDEERKE
jgi:hypothetical protein